MASLRYIAKNAGAMLTSSVINSVADFVLNFVYLRSFGPYVAADWVALSASVSYLGNLNFGIQTFVNQDVTVRYNRGERDTFHVMQSTALRALIALSLIVAACSLVVFLIPVERLIPLTMGAGDTTWMGHLAASTALYFIILQVLTGSFIFSFFAGAFMGVGKAHRGANWNNVQRLTTSVLLCVLALMREPLYVLAIGQWVLYMLLLVALIVDLKRTAPDIFPTLRYWDRAVFREMASPSFHFMLLYGSNWLAFEAPILLFKRLVGPVPTLIFYYGRKIFSAARTLLTGLTQAIGPEITRIFGAQDWDGMLGLYDYSERIIFFLIAVFNIPLLIISPLLLMLWLHQPGYFDLRMYLLLALVATVVCVKEHKMQFQFSTNTHITYSRANFYGYVLLTLVSIPAVRRFGAVGFLAGWLVVEVLQTGLIVALNRKLFAAYRKLSYTYLWRLAGLSVVGYAAGVLLLLHERHAGWGVGVRVGVSAAEVVMVAAVAWFAFGMSPLTAFMKAKIQARLRPST